MAVALLLSVAFTKNINSNLSFVDVQYATIKVDCVLMFVTLLLGVSFRFRLLWSLPLYELAYTSLHDSHSSCRFKNWDPTREDMRYILTEKIVDWFMLSNLCCAFAFPPPRNVHMLSKPQQQYGSNQRKAKTPVGNLNMMDWSFFQIQDRKSVV